MSNGVSGAVWSSFPASDESCGDTFLRGAGGEITSPGYPSPYPGHARCVWTIKVEPEMTVVLNFIELDLGPSGKYLITSRRHEQQFRRELSYRIQAVFGSIDDI